MQDKGKDWPSDATVAAADPAAPSLTERRQAFGTKMRTLREKHGMSVAALAQMTRIGANYIEALETGALERLPGEVFGRGFVRCIAKNLRSDGAPLLAEFNGLWETSTPKSVLKVEIKSRPVKVRSDRFSAMLANARSLARRGVVVKVALPLGAAALFVYGLVATPMVRTLMLNVRGAPAAMAPAKQLDLQPVDQNEAARSDAAPSENEPVAVQAEVGRPPSEQEAENRAAQDLAAAAGVAPDAAEGGSGEAASAAVGGGTPDGAPAHRANEAAVSHADPAPAAPIAEAAKAKATAAPSSGTLEIVVSEPVRIKLDVDKGPAVTKELKPDTYKFTFVDHADMMVYDAGAVKISFNGHPLGSLGNKGRVRRLSFQAQPGDAKKL